MPWYITYGIFQKQMKDYFDRTGNRMQFPEMISYLHKKRLLEESCPNIQIPELCGEMPDDTFEALVDTLPLTLEPNQPTALKVTETDIIPHARDVFLIRHPRYTRPHTHSHNYFEVNYVAKGTCEFVFENVSRSMGEGELCIIAPSSEHDIILTDESIVYSMMIRKSTFDTTFFSLMSRKDLLSYFFRTILQNDTHANYLLFCAKGNKQLKYILQNALLECHRKDAYSNTCCINWVNLLFSVLLRNYGKSLQFYNYHMGSDFSLVLQYIQHNYQTITLSALAELFHYSEPHLCTLIKQNTGHNFTDLIKRLRLSDAMDYLMNTDQKISEIAERIGYNSADHFSRVFRSVYHMSPQKYRAENHAQTDSLEISI